MRLPIGVRLDFKLTARRTLLLYVYICGWWLISDYCLTIYDLWIIVWVYWFNITNDFTRKQGTHIPTHDLRSTSVALHAWRGITAHDSICKFNVHIFIIWQSDHISHTHTTMCIIYPESFHITEEKSETITMNERYELFTVRWNGQTEEEMNIFIRVSRGMSLRMMRLHSPMANIVRMLPAVAVLQ